MKVIISFFVVFAVSSAGWSRESSSILMAPEFTGLRWIQSESGDGHVEQCSRGNCNAITGEMSREEFGDFITYSRDRLLSQSNASFAEAVGSVYWLAFWNAAAVVIALPTLAIEAAALNSTLNKAFVMAIAPVGYAALWGIDYLEYRRQRKHSAALVQKIDAIEPSDMVFSMQAEPHVRSKAEYNFFVRSLRYFWRDYSKR